MAVAALLLETEALVLNRYARSPLRVSLQLSLDFYNLSYYHQRLPIFRTLTASVESSVYDQLAIALKEVPTVALWLL